MKQANTAQELQYKKHWSIKTIKQIEKEITSWQKHFDKHGQSYAWHGGDATPPGTLADGDKVAILKEILNDKKVSIN